MPLLTAIMAAAGCTSSTMSTSDSPPTDGPDHPEVISTYHGYIATGNMLARSVEGEHPWMVEHAEPGAYDPLLDQVAYHRDQGLVYASGVKVLWAEVVAAGGDEVWVVACVDVGEFVPVDANGVPAESVTEVLRPSTTVVRWSSNGWRVAHSDAFDDTVRPAVDQCPTGRD